MSQKHELTELRDTDGDEVADEHRIVATWPFGGNFHEFAFGLLYPGRALLPEPVGRHRLWRHEDQPAARAQPRHHPQGRRRTGEVEYIAGGPRTPHGIGWGPGNNLFVTDNQGGGLPASKLVHVKQD